MDDGDRDSVQEHLVGRWIDDLLAGRGMSSVPAELNASAQDIREAAQLAQWWASGVATPRPQSLEIEEVLGRLSNELRSAAVEQDVALEEMLVSESQFGVLLERALDLIAMSTAALSSRVDVPEETIQKLVRGEFPPHRVPTERMGDVLRWTRLRTPAILDMVRDACRQWVTTAYAHPGTAFGRIDGAGHERGQILSDAATRDEQGIAAELREIDEFCTRLHGVLEAR